MRDSSVVYVNEALDYCFTFICHLFETFFISFFYYFFFYGFKVGTFDFVSPQQILSMQFNRFVHTLKSSQLGMGLLN